MRWHPLHGFKLFWICRGYRGGGVAVVYSSSLSPITESAWFQILWNFAYPVSWIGKFFQTFFLLFDALLHGKQFHLIIISDWITLFPGDCALHKINFLSVGISVFIWIILGTHQSLTYFEPFSRQQNVFGPIYRGRHTLDLLITGSEQQLSVKFRHTISISVTTMRYSQPRPF